MSPLRAATTPAVWLSAALLMAAAIGCSSQRPVDVWKMPDIREPNPATSPQHKSMPEGYPWAFARAGSRGGDATSDDDGHAGDLPETGYDRPQGFWQYDEESAVREAHTSGRGLFVSFHAEWCDVCIKLEHDTLRDGDLRITIAMRFVPLRIDVTEETHSNREQLERYRVMQLPALIMFDDEGRKLMRFDEYVSAELILRDLDRLTPPRP